MLASFSTYASKIMGKALFIIELKFPLINAINIKMTNLKDKKADIILMDNNVDMRQIARNLENLEIFENVYLGNDINIGEAIKESLKRRKNIISSSLVEFRRIRNTLWGQFNEQTFVKKCIIDGRNIDLDEYDEIYVKNDNRLTDACLRYLIKNSRINKINIIEEGINSYCNEKQSKVFFRYLDNLVLWVYSKELFVFDYRKYTIKDINKLKSDDITFKSILNYIFGYLGFEKDIHKNSIIYFEQVSEPLPDYLVNISAVKKFLLYNSYQKACKENRLYVEKCKTIDTIEKTLRKHLDKLRFYIKLHPRTIHGLPEKYKNYIWENNQISNIPWELYYLNNPEIESMWITNASGAVTNPLYCFENTSKLRIGLTYRLDEQYRYYLNPNLDKFYQKLTSQYHCLNIYNSYGELQEDILFYMRKTTYL